MKESGHHVSLTYSDMVLTALLAIEKSQFALPINAFCLKVAFRFGDLTQ